MEKEGTTAETDLFSSQVWNVVLEEPHLMLTLLQICSARESV
jgi:hypothetical protein